MAVTPELWKKIGELAIDLAAPISWGLIVLFLSNSIEAFVRRHGKSKGLNEAQSTMPPLEYHI